VLINVYFGKTQLALVLLAQFLKTGAMAGRGRTTKPKIHNHRLIGLSTLDSKSASPRETSCYVLPLSCTLFQRIEFLL